MTSARAWDLALARRAAAVAALSVLLTLLVVVSTDAGDPWPLRLGMTGALAPLCGALGALATVRLAAARGELRALAAVGADPARAVLGAACGGSAVGLAGVGVVASGAGDLGGLFPRGELSRRWVVDGAGLRELTLGLRLSPQRTLSLEAVSHVVAAGLPAGATQMGLLGLAVAAAVGPAWVVAIGALGGSRVRRAVVGSVAALAAIAAFQGVAAGRVPVAALLGGPVLLLGDALAVLAVHRARVR